MHEELIKNIRSIKQRLGIGVITTINGTDHHLMNQLNRMEELVNKNFGLADVVERSEQLKAFVDEFIEAWEDGNSGDSDLYKKAKSL